MKRILVQMCLLLAIVSGNAQTQKSKTTVNKPRTTTAAKSRAATANRKTSTAAPKKRSVANLCPNNNHPHAIDLGLPTGTKWACSNVGAGIPEDYGGLFAQGEVKAKKYFGIENYKHHGGTDNWNDGYYCNDFFDICGSEYDAAKVVMGKRWIMPTCALFDELMKNCIYEWVEFNGVYGAKLTGPNGNAIFMPAAGHKNRDELKYLNEEGQYWPCNQVMSNIEKGSYSCLYLYPDRFRLDLLSTKWRFEGRSIRAIADE